MAPKNKGGGAKGKASKEEQREQALQAVVRNCTGVDIRHRLTAAL